MEFSNLVDEANIAFQNNRIYESIKLFNQALKLNPKSFDVCYKLGLLTFQVGDLKNSINFFKKTLLLNPQSSLAYSNLGLIYSKLNNKKLALHNYLKSYEIDPNNFTLNYNLGSFYFSNNDYENSEKHFKLAIQLNPQNFFSYNNLFQLYDRSNNFEKLEAIFDQTLKLFGRTNEVKFLEGNLKYKKKKYKETIKIFKDLEFDKRDYQKNILKNNILAKCYDEVGSYSKAYDCYYTANQLTENVFKNNFDKNKFNERIISRLNSTSNNKSKISLNKETYDDREDPVFLIGFPRSGTTLLDTILRTHLSIEVIEEELLVFNVIEKLNYHINNDLLNLNTINREKIKQIRDYYFNERELLVGFKKKILYIDKLPLNIIYLAELNKIFPKAKFIFALRNPHDVILSCFMQPFLPNDAMSNFYNLEDAYEFYDLVMRLWENYNQILNINIHQVKYENVVNDFDNTIKQLLEFLGLKWIEEVKNFYLTASNRGIINTPSYNQVNSPIYNKSINRWKNYQDKFTLLDLKLQNWSKKFKYQISFSKLNK